MNLSSAQITKLHGLIALHVSAQVDVTHLHDLPDNEQTDCRVYADLAAAKLAKYIDGLAIVPRLKGVPA